jgi:hypothetical protein
MREPTYHDTDPSPVANVLLSTYHVVSCTQPIDNYWAGPDGSSQGDDHHCRPSHLLVRRHRAQ